MISRINLNRTNDMYFQFSQGKRDELRVPIPLREIELPGYNVSGAILARNNITFRNLAKKIEGKDHLDLPNIHVYEYPDTNLKVFICENDNSNDDKDRILMKSNKVC